jgi:HEAT repeat protein
LGFPEPLKADSGNGAHLLYRINLDNTVENKELLKKCMEAISLFHTNEVCKVDTSVYNASRIWKLYGTVARKGDSIPERPHRRAKIISKPAEIKVVDLSLLEKLANIVPREEDAVIDESRYTHYGNRQHQYRSTFVLGKWLEEHKIEARHRKWESSSDLYVLKKCPFSDAHVDGAYAIQFQNGGLFAGCHHDSCGGRQNRWKELWSKYETDDSIKSKFRIEQSTYRERRDNGFNNSNLGQVKDNYAVHSEKIDSVIEKNLIRINILRCVNLLQNPPFGRQQIRNILQGRKMKKIDKYGHQNLFVYSSLRGFSDEMIMRQIDELMQEGYLVNSGGFHPTIRITEEGKRVLGDLNKLDDDQTCAQKQDKELVETFDCVQSIENLLTKLESASATDRMWAIEEITLLGDEKGISPIICMLDDKDEDVRAIAVKCLGMFKDPLLFNPIYKKINDPAAIVRAFAFVAIREMGTSSALRGLVFCLENRDEHIRRDAAYNLGELRHYDAVKPLLSTLKRDRNDGIKEEALIALGKIRDPSTLTVIRNELNRNSLVNKEAACIAIGHFKDIDSTHTLVEYVKHPYERVRRAAIEGLGLMENPDAVDSIIPALKDVHNEVRSAAAIALGRIGSINGVPALIESLDDCENSVREHVIYSLSKIGYMKSLSYLKKLLEDPDPDIRDCAREAIMKIKSRTSDTSS